MNATTAKFVVRRLSSGKILTNVQTGSYTLVSDSDIRLGQSSAAAINVGHFLYNARAFVSLADLRMLAARPWSLWYDD